MPSILTRIEHTLSEAQDALVRNDHEAAYRAVVTARFALSQVDAADCDRWLVEDHCQQLVNPGRRCWEPSAIIDSEGNGVCATHATNAIHDRFGCCG